MIFAHKLIKLQILISQSPVSVLSFSTAQLNLNMQLNHGLVNSTQVNNFPKYYISCLDEPHGISKGIHKELYCSAQAPILGELA